MKKYTSYISIALIFFIPTLAFAALDGIRGLLIAFRGILGLLVPVLFGLSLIYFFWGVGQFILHDAGNDKTREDGKKKIMWGIIALFVFVSIYGILKFIGTAVSIDVPVTNTQSGSQNGNNQGDVCWPECSDGRGGCFPCN